MGKQSPAKQRYNTAHPTISARVDSSLKAELDAYTKQRGISVADFIKEALAGHSNSYGDGYQQGCLAGLEYMEDKVPSLCPTCGEVVPIPIDDFKYITGVIKDSAEVKCPECGTTIREKRFDM